MFKKNEFLVFTVAEEILKDVAIKYKEQEKFTGAIYQLLYSVFKDTLIRSLDVIDTCTIAEFFLPRQETPYMSRISGYQQQYFLYSDNINFCFCDYFTDVVLRDKQDFICEHILALKLAKILDKDKRIKKIQMTAEDVNKLSNH